MLGLIFKSHEETLSKLGRIRKVPLCPTSTRTMNSLRNQEGNCFAPIISINQIDLGESQQATNPPIH